MKVVKKFRRSKKNVLLISGVILLITSLATFLGCIFIIPKIELVGDDIIVMEVGDVYKEPGYDTRFKDRDISNRVEIIGDVDTNVLGTYILKYKISYGLFSNVKVRIVEVVDRESPVLELKGEKEVFICPNSTYKEDGYEVSDNYDKEFDVKREERDNEIFYEVVDSSGNSTSQTRKINHVDLEKPNIILKGNKTKVIYLDSVYQEDGYLATDNCDGDITSKVEVIGSVNTHKLGTYKIRYNVIDKALNQTSVERVIQVIQKPNNKNGVIYLTFDDGPSSTITSKVLDILKKEGVKATFFVINASNDLNYLIKREYDEGHTVALHSYTHNYANIYQSSNNYFDDLNKIQDKVKQITGSESKIIRFPGGSSNSVSKKYQSGIMSVLTNEVLSRGYHYFDWNVSSGDAGGVKSSSEVYKNVISGLKFNQANVVLMHDFENNYYTLNALEDIIRYGKENGYQFLNITYDTAMIRHRVQN